MLKTSSKNLQGCLFIGDPHVSGRCPDFRSDDYPNVVLNKIAWCLDHAKQKILVPVFLGDLFDKPRDNPTWMIGRLIEAMRGSNSIGIYGNHDCAEPVLTDNDSMMLLVKAGCLQLVSTENPWVGLMSGRPVLIGGSSYRERIPETVVLDDKVGRHLANDSEVSSDQQTPLFGTGYATSQKTEDSSKKCKPLGIWLTHHDLAVGDYEGARFGPFAIENIDLVVNGHIHKRSEPVKRGKTLWINPGNISRRSRNETCRVQEPAVMQLLVTEKGFEVDYLTVPHDPFEEVFHEQVFDGEDQDGASAFVAGLSELRQRKTSSGAGLIAFLQKNLDQFSDPVGDEIMALANQVTTD